MENFVFTLEIPRAMSILSEFSINQLILFVSVVIETMHSASGELQLSEPWSHAITTLYSLFSAPCYRPRGKGEVQVITPARTHHVQRLAGQQQTGYKA